MRLCSGTTFRGSICESGWGSVCWSLRRARRRRRRGCRSAGPRGRGRRGARGPRGDGGRPQRRAAAGADHGQRRSASDRPGDRPDAWTSSTRRACPIPDPTLVYDLNFLADIAHAATDELHAIAAEPGAGPDPERGQRIDRLTEAAAARLAEINLVVDGWNERSRDAVVEVPDDDGVLVIRSTDRLVYNGIRYVSIAPAAGRSAGTRPAPAADRPAGPRVLAAGCARARSLRGLGDRGPGRILRQLPRVQPAPRHARGAVRRGPKPGPGASLRASGGAARPADRRAAGRPCRR